MIISRHQVGGEQTATRTLVCQLRKRTEGRGAGSALAGEIELQNTSGSLIEIPIRMSPLQHLNLVVTNSQQQVVSTGYYGDLFSPGSEERAFRLLPGEKFVGNVSLLATVPKEMRLPGIYLVQAFYETDGVRAVSPPYELVWDDEQGG
jgi:hypothetical protein